MYSEQRLEQEGNIFAALRASVVGIWHRAPLLYLGINAEENGHF